MTISLSALSKLTGIAPDDLMPPDYSQYEPPDTLFKTGSPLFELADADAFQMDGPSDEAASGFRLGYEGGLFDVCLKQGGAFCFFARANNADRLIARAKLFGRTVEVTGTRFKSITVSAHAGKGAV
jgi:hypothetical protein